MKLSNDFLFYPFVGLPQNEKEQIQTQEQSEGGLE